MKKHLLSFLLMMLTGIAITSCSSDEISPKDPLSRDYQTDALVLSRFVDVNLANNEYFINESKKMSILSYITDKDWQELQNVNPVNKARYEKELWDLNSQLALIAQDPTISYIVFSTYGGSYIKELNSDAPFKLEKPQYNSVASRGRYQSLSIMGGRTDAYFTAGNSIHSNVNITYYSYYLFELKCNTSKAICNNNNSTGVVFSGTGISTGTSYTWTKKSNAAWDFTCTGRAPSSGTIGQIDFTD